MQKPIIVEPRQASELDFYSAHASAAGVRCEHDPVWPGPQAQAAVEEVSATEPSCAAYRKYMERASEATCCGLLADADKRAPRPAPRVPRESGEPAHLHVVLVLLVFVGSCVTLLAASMLHGIGWLLGLVAEYADAFLPAVARWIGGVL